MKSSMVEPLPADDDIIIDHVYKSFGKTKALVDVSLRVKRGEVGLIFGPSGGGKAPFSVASITWRSPIAVPSSLTAFM